MGQIYGKAGKSLAKGQNHDFAASGEVARLGFLGEQMVGGILNSAMEGRPNVHVFHDVNIPLQNSGYNANIDHILLIGNCLYLIDAKRWSAGFYFRLGRFCLRKSNSGKFQLFPSGAKKTMCLARDKMTLYLQQIGTVYHIKKSYLVLCAPKDTGKFNLSLYKPYGATAITSQDFRQILERDEFKSNSPSNPKLVEALKRLVA
jgi:hypothetical protein